MTERPTAPRHAQLLVDYANSIDHELATDDLTTPDELVAWLSEHELLDGGGRATAGDVALARRLRDALQVAFAGNHDGTGDLADLDAVAAELPVRLGGAGPRPGVREPGVVPVHDGVRGGLERLVAAVTASVVDDSWRRLKVCSADDCGWSYYDASKNRSRTWCEWGCGNKAKTRSYRARRKAGAS